jgi:hypothetical protein
VPARIDKAMADGGAIKGSEDAMQRCNELDAELAELRASYDSYFMGNDRLPPLKKHEGFKKQYLKLKGTFVRQTAAKFRIESIGQRLLTFERLWDRTIKDIESGTYKRDLMRLKRHGNHGQKKKEANFDVDEDLDISDLEDDNDDLASALAAAEASASAKAAAAAKPVAPAIVAVTPPGGVKPAVTPPPAGLKPLTAPIPVTPPGGAKPVGPPKISAPLATGATPAFKPAGSTGANPALKPAGSTGANAAFKPAGLTGANAAFRPAASAAPPRPPAAGGGDGGLSDTKVKAIYDAYVMAKKRCGEDTRTVTLDSVASSLRKQVPELMKQHNAKTVEFKVVIKDGKAVLRALPKD